MLKKIALAVLIVLLLVGGVLAWMWHQATALPDWYTEGDAAQYAGEADEGEPSAPLGWIAVDEDGEALPESEPIPLAPLDPSQPTSPTPTDEAAAQGSTAPRPRRSRSSSPSRAQRHELRGFHRQKGRKPSPAIKASRAVYEHDHLEIGVIFDIRKLDRDKLGPRSRERYDRALESFPGITHRDVWIGVDDEPISVGGYLQLSEDAQVRVGKLTYSLASAARRLGMTPIELRLQLNRELRRLGFVDPAA